MGNAVRADQKPIALDRITRRRKRAACQGCYEVSLDSSIEQLIVPEQAQPPVGSPQDDDEDNYQFREAAAWPAVQIDLLYMEHLSLLKDAGLQLGDWNPGSITAEDTLLVIDMQNDFFSSKVAPMGGRMTVPEGESAVRPVVSLIQAFARSDALIVATRDYHAADHVSFYDQGGPYPPHCMQGTAGSFFYSDIGDVLQDVSEASAAGNIAARVEVGFKGFIDDVDSLGAFRYEPEYSRERMRHSQTASDASSSSCPWTGAMALKCSQIAKHINAPPDVGSVLGSDLRPLDEVIPRSGRLLIVGMALDLGVLDSAVCAAHLGYQQVFVALDACRPTYFKSGEYGSGFLTDPRFLVQLFQTNGITLVQSADVLGDFEPLEPHAFTASDLFVD